MSFQKVNGGALRGTALQATPGLLGVSPELVPQIPFPNTRWLSAASRVHPRATGFLSSCELSLEPNSTESSEIYSSCGQSLIKVSPNESAPQEVHETFCVKSACHLECVLSTRSPARALVVAGVCPQGRTQTLEGGESRPPNHNSR